MKRMPVVSAVVAMAALAAPAAGAAVPDRYILPGDAVFPEGVATRPENRGSDLASRHACPRMLDCKI